MFIYVYIKIPVRFVLNKSTRGANDKNTWSAVPQRGGSEKEDPEEISWLSDLKWTSLWLFNDFEGGVGCPLRGTLNDEPRFAAACRGLSLPRPLAVPLSVPLSVPSCPSLLPLPVPSLSPPCPLPVPALSPVREQGLFGVCCLPVSFARAWAPLLYCFKKEINDKTRNT